MIIELALIASLFIEWIGMMWWGPWGPWGWGYWGPGPMMLLGVLWLFLFLLVLAFILIFIAWALKRVGVLR